MSEAKEQPIIIIKKKGGHGGHHGGAWKVAYADFVTAMMAFFMVMWLMNSGEKVKQAVAGYFKDPSGFGKERGSAVAGSGESLKLNQDNMSELKDKLEQALKEMPDFQMVKDNITMTVTGEGLRIELLESEKGMFFQSGSPDPTGSGEELLIKMAGELSQIPNTVLIEGHTDSKPFNREGYSNWELSVDRANAARRLMMMYGLRSDQVMQVRGFADQRLFTQDDPEHPSNRRISVLVQYADSPPGTNLDPMTEAGKKAAGGEGGEPAPAAGAKAEEAKPEEKKSGGH